MQTPSTVDPVASTKGQLLAALRYHRDDPDVIADRQSALAAAKIAKFVERTLAGAPRLSSEQAADLARLILSSSAR